MATSQCQLSSDELWPVNELTRLSREPGNLDYDAYRQYLAAFGHIKPHFNVPGLIAPARPQNTFLQGREGDRIDDKTDCRADQVLWTQDNLPDILYIFVKPELWLAKHELQQPPLKTYKIYGVKLRDIPILPDHISSKVEGWRVEAWMRLDPRLNLMDILDRMEPSKRPPNKSIVQMRTLRFRKDCKVLGWVALGKNYQLRKRELQSEMSKQGIDQSQNSTRGMSWGLKDPTLGEAGGRVLVPDSRRQGNTVDMTKFPSTPPEQGITITSSPSMPPTPWIPRHAPVFRSDQQARQNPSIDDHSDVFNSQVFHGANLFTRTTNHRSIPPTTLFTRNTLPTNPPYQQNPHPQLQSLAQIQEHHQRQRPLPRPLFRQSTPPSPTPTRITLTYYGKPLTLKTPDQRARDAIYVARLRREWHPAGSDGRRLQLAYILDPAKVRCGFVDNRGHWPPAGGVWECIDADIVYRQDTTE